MRPTWEATRVLYVDSYGRVCSGRLVLDPQRRGDSGPVLLSRTDRALRPADVLALVVSHPVSEDQRAALSRAEEAGYRVEET